MYIDSSNHFVVSSMFFFLVNFDLFCIIMKLEIFFVNYFVVQWRLSSTIALCLWAFWSKDCSRKKTLLIMAVNKTYWKWHDCVWLSLAAPVAICSRRPCSLWQLLFIFWPIWKNISQNLPNINTSITLGLHLINYILGALIESHCNVRILLRICTVSRITQIWCNIFFEGKQ